MKSLDGEKNEMTRILVMQKPGAKDRVSAIREFISSHGTIIREKKVLVDAWRIGQHYKEFMGKCWFKRIVEYYTGQVVHVWELHLLSTSIEDFRVFIGDAKSPEGSFRFCLMGDRIEMIKKEFGVLDNGIHTSDSLKSGIREINLWFQNPSLYPIYQDTYQTYLDGVHEELYSSLEELASKKGCYLQFAGGTHNGLGLAENKADLDYRVLVPSNTPLTEVFNYLCSKIPNLVWDKEGADPTTGALYIKGEVNFQGGKADIAVVPFKHYSSKVSGAHLATLMPREYIDNARSRKSVALSISKAQYKAVKHKISKEIKRSLGW